MFVLCNFMNLVCLRVRCPCFKMKGNLRIMFSSTNTVDDSLVPSTLGPTSVPSLNYKINLKLFQITKLPSMILDLYYAPVTNSAGLATKFHFLFSIFYCLSLFTMRDKHGGVGQFRKISKMKKKNYKIFISND